MKVLMVNSNQYKLPVPSMPFGLCLVSSSLEKAGHEVSVLDLCFSTNPTREIEKAIKEFQPGIIGVSVRNIDTVSYYNTYFLLEPVKNNVIIPIKKAFQGPIVIGGTAVGILGAEILKYFDLEYAILGDGELAMVEFVNRIEKKKSLKGLGGLTWRENGEIFEENPLWRVEDLDSLPLSNPQRYLDLKTYRKFRAPIQIQTKRGCVLKCTYCTYNKIEGHEYRLRDPLLVADEIESIYKKTGIKHFEFSDSTFNIPLDHSKAVLRAIIDKNIPGLNLRTMGLNPGDIDEEFADLLKKADFKDVECGPEAGCDKMLKALGKNFQNDAILRTGRILHDIDMPTMWYLLTGAPGETIDTLKETAEIMKMAASEWDLVVVLNGIRVNKGTPLASQWLKENPNCTKDNFLRPVFYSSESVNLEVVRVVNKLIAFQNPNHLFPEEVQRVPLIALKIQTFIMRNFAPQQPWWRFNILLNRIQKKSGIYFLKRKIFEFKNRKILKTLEFRDS
jgi:radical SAM superfamily enzyme YgiQ (UPF0313 family)